LLLLEHVLSAQRVIRPIMNVANPVVVRTIGANINRQTVANVERAGLRVQSATNLWFDIVQLIEAEAVKDER
jgi:phosphatidylethanolamine/phosphatidyl-N-methylethanolamine N-methyltransferase